MHDPLPGERRFQASLTAFVVAMLAIASFVPPLSGYVGATTSPLIATALGITIGAAYVAHLIFLAMAVAHMGRSVVRWLLLAILLAPLGSIPALIVLGFHGAEGEWQRAEDIGPKHIA